MSDPWDARCRELREFREAHGHCDVPARHPRGLGTWARRQRCEEATGYLDAGRVRRLEALGFAWGTREPITGRRGCWEARFQEWEEFREAHGHGVVPPGHRGGLGRWAHRQRIEKATGCLDADRAQKLDELGFPWGGRKAMKDRRNRWAARLRELQEFEEEHGHCNVPSHHPGGLGRWVTYQSSQEDEERLDARTKKREEFGVERDGGTCREETGDATARKRQKKTSAAEDHDQVSVRLDKNNTETRSCGKEGTGVMESSDPRGHERSPATKPQSPRAAEDTLTLSSTKDCGPTKKHTHAATFVMESGREAAIDTSVAKASAISETLSSAQSEENANSDLLGDTSLDAAIAGTSGGSRNNQRELAAMDTIPRLLDEEEHRQPSSLDHTPPAAAEEDASLVRQGDSVEVVSKVAGMCGDAHIER